MPHSCDCGKLPHKGASQAVFLAGRARRVRMVPRSGDCGEREGRAPYEKFCPTAATAASYPIRARRSQLFLRGAPCEKCCHAATTVASAPQPLFFWGQRAPYEKFCPTAATVAARRILGATRVPHNNFPQQRLRQYTHSSPSQFVHLAASGFFHATRV